MAEAIVNQVRHYTDTIPTLYRYVEIVGASDYVSARVGTITTPAEHFAEWKTMSSDEAERARPQLELMIDGVFAPARFLDLIRDFVFFETDGAKTWKVLAKYHQVDAVHAAVESVARAMGGDKRGGVVWHTQGAGKSYTMVFLVNKLRRDPRFGNPTIVAVTDRTDLDNQLADTFTGTHLATACRQAEEITGGPSSLHELLKVPAGGIVFTTIQKFAPARGRKMPVLSERENVIVMADEAHRSQYAKFAENITIALPNAVRIGFTGTPVEKADRSTLLVFGEYVSVYRMRQAQEDHATVPIYYESRQIPVEIEDPDELRHVEEVLEGEEEAAASKLVTAWAKLEKVVGAPDRLRRLADDAVEHYQARCEALEGKAMVVAYSRRIAAELTGLLRERLGADAVDCVISAQATDRQEISRFRRSKPELKELAKRFKDPDDPLRVVVVKDMWLTGFRRARAAHAVRGQADARPRAVAGDRAREPGVPGQARRADRRLHRDRRGPPRVSARLRREGRGRAGDPSGAGGRGAVGEVRGALRDAAPDRLPPGRAATRAEPGEAVLRRLQPDPRKRREDPGVPRHAHRAHALVRAGAHAGGGDRAARRHRVLQQARRRGAQDHGRGRPGQPSGRAGGAPVLLRGPRRR